MRLANQVNLASALRTSLLLLPESFTEVQLFETIAGLSYRGDFRMKVGENPHKVRNIVAAQLPSFRSLYGGLLKSFWKSVHTIGEDGNGVRLMRQDQSASVRASTASRLPKGLRDKVLGHYERKWNLEGAIALSKAKSVGSKDRPDGPKEDEGRIDLDQQKLWERIVEDAEFKSIVSKSQYSLSSNRLHSEQPSNDAFDRFRLFACQVSVKSSRAPRSTSLSRGSCPQESSGPSDTLSRNCARSSLPPSRSDLFPLCPRSRISTLSRRPLSLRGSARGVVSFSHLIAPGCRQVAITIEHRSSSMPAARLGRVVVDAETRHTISCHCPHSLIENTGPCRLRQRNLSI